MINDRIINRKQMLMLITAVVLLIVGIWLTVQQRFISPLSENEVDIIFVQPDASPSPSILLP